MALAGCASVRNITERKRFDSSTFRKLTCQEAAAHGLRGNGDVKNHRTVNHSFKNYERVLNVEVTCGVDFLIAMIASALEAIHDDVDLINYSKPSALEELQYRYSAEMTTFGS